MSPRERVFAVAGTPLVFGPGAAGETGWHLRAAGVTRALALTDPHLAAIGLPDPVLEAIRTAGVEVELFSECGDVLFRQLGQNEPTTRAPIDFNWVHLELRRAGVTRQLLWTEYQEAVASGPTDGTCTCT